MKKKIFAFLCILSLFIVMKISYSIMVINAQQDLGVNQLQNDTSTPFVIRNIAIYDYYISHAFIIIPVIIGIYLFRKEIKNLATISFDSLSNKGEKVK